MALLRYGMALLFLTTAIGKLLDNRGFAEVLATYQILPAAILLGVGLVLSLGEFVIGLALLNPDGFRRGAIAALTLNSGYLGLAIVTNLRGLAIKNCGCFGVFLARPMSWNTVVEDLFIVGLSFTLYRASKRGSRKRQTRIPYK